MIRKYRYGAPFDTEAVTEKIETADGIFPYGKIPSAVSIFSVTASVSKGAPYLYFLIITIFLVFQKRGKKFCPFKSGYLLSVSRPVTCLFI